MLGSSLKVVYNSQLNLQCERTESASVERKNVIDFELNSVSVILNQ